MLIVYIGSILYIAQYINIATINTSGKILGVLFKHCGVKMVRIETICTCMWGGKSEEIAKRAKIAKFAKKKILVALPTKDDREERSLSTMLRNPIFLGDYKNLFIRKIDNFEKLRDILLEIDPDVLILDEIHMFGSWLVGFIDELRFLDKYKTKNLTVIVSGLDMDFQGKPFENIGLIMAMAHDIHKLSHAICKKCEEKKAIMTYRKPKYNKVDPERIKAGGEKDYEPRCWECYLEDIQKNP